MHYRFKKLQFLKGLEVRVSVGTQVTVFKFSRSFAIEQLIIIVE